MMLPLVALAHVILAGQKSNSGVHYDTSCLKEQRMIVLQTCLIDISS